MSILTDGELPVSYIVPVPVWKNDVTGMFVHRTYEGKKSKPEYGMNLSAKNMHFIENYKLEKMIDRINE